MEIKKIGVIGSGTMGHSITLAFAMYGYDVNIIDINQNVLEKAKGKIVSELNLMVDVGFIQESNKQGVLDNITFTTKSEEGLRDRDYVIEAVSENLSIKQKVFVDMDRYSPEHAILASNTSSLKLEDITKEMSPSRVSRVMINHWFNPAHIMPIVELSYFGNTSDEIYQAVDELYASIKKQRIKVYKDISGLVGTRLQQVLAREVYYLLEEKVVDEEDIDKAIKYGPAFRHVTSGLLEVCDMGGIDIWTAVAETLFKELSNASGPSELLLSKIEQGHLGAKSGQGFYQYESDNLQEMKDQFNRRLLKQLMVMDK